MPIGKSVFTAIMPAIDEIMNLININRIEVNGKPHAL